MGGPDVRLEAGYRRLEDGAYAGVVVSKVVDEPREQADVRDEWGYLAVFDTKRQAIGAAQDRIRRIARTFVDSVDNVEIVEIGEVAERPEDPRVWRRRALGGAGSRFAWPWPTGAA